MSMLSDSLPALNGYVYSTGASAYSVPGSSSSPPSQQPSLPPTSPYSPHDYLGDEYRAQVKDAGIFGLTIQRVVIIILGLLIIAAGLFMLKPVRETVEAAAVA